MCIHSIGKEMKRDSAATNSQLLIASSEIGQSFNITITTCSWGAPEAASSLLPSDGLDTKTLLAWTDGDVDKNLTRIESSIQLY